MWFSHSSFRDESLAVGFNPHPCSLSRADAFWRGLKVPHLHAMAICENKWLPVTVSSRVEADAEFSSW